MSIVTNENRVGRFTSSKISLLMANGRGKDDIFSVAAKTYIKQKYYERKLKRSIDMGKGGQAANWGLFLEQYVYSNFAGLNYVISSNETTLHPTIKNLAGSTDLFVPGVKVSDIKCFEPLNFCELADCMQKNDREIFKKEFSKEYWQLVSNAMIHGVTKAESIVYMPTETELEEIRERAMNYDGEDQWKYRFIYESPKYQLAYVPDNSEYQSFNKFEFDVPQEDVDLLTERLALAELEIVNLQNQAK